MKKTTTVATALALAVGTSVAPAQAQTAEQGAPTGYVQYAEAPAAGSSDNSGSAEGGSLQNELVQAGLLLVAGLAVSAGLAVAAGIRGGAIPLPQIPGLPPM